jgi:hypothetical protein
MAVQWTMTFALSGNGVAGGTTGYDNETGGNTSQYTYSSFPANTNAAVNANAAQFTLNFNAATIQALYMLATQPCTITTNNASSPTNTITLVAGQPLWWGRSQGYFANPINANTNAGFITCVASTILTVGVLTT